VDKTFKDAILDDSSYCEAQSICFRNVQTGVDIQITVITAEITKKMEEYLKITSGIVPSKYVTRVALADKGDPQIGVINMTDEMR
jgi:hypothetical protein